MSPLIGALPVWAKNVILMGIQATAAVFGDFRYRSHSLGKVVSSPFSILVKVVEGMVTYVQYLEDSYATAASFRQDGSWTVQTAPAAQPFRV